MKTCVSFIVVFSSLQGVFIASTTRVAGGVMKPRFNTTSEVVKVTEGHRAILPCSVQYLGQYSVIWVNPRKILLSHNDRRVIDDPRISVERPFVREWNLLIRHARYNDSGTYECRTNTQPTKTKKVTLVVQVPPVILSELSTDRVSKEEKETVTLVCNVTGIPTPNVTWYKRNSRQIDGKKERVGSEGEVLVIHNVSRNCDDIYECYVDNGVPPAVSKAIRVIVNYAPEVHLPTKRLGQIVGKETILDCIISAKPQAVTEWRRGGRALRKSDKHDIYIFRDDLQNSVTLSLRIKTLEMSDYGQYLCVGSNHLGEDQKEMTLYQIFPTTTTTTTTATTTATQPINANTRSTNKPAGTTTLNKKKLEYLFGPDGQLLSDGQMSHSSSPHQGNDKTVPESGPKSSRSAADSHRGQKVTNLFMTQLAVFASAVTSICLQHFL